MSKSETSSARLYSRDHRCAQSVHEAKKKKKGSHNKPSSTVRLRETKQFVGERRKETRQQKPRDDLDDEGGRVSKADVFPLRLMETAATGK